MDTKKGLCRIGRKMAAAGLVAACDGNISFRRADGLIVITPSGVPKGELKPKRLLVLNLDGQVVAGVGKPSSEAGMHLAIYRQRKDVHAIIHAHPQTATAITVAGIPFPADVVTAGAMVLGHVPTVPYAAPGSPELAQETADAAMHCNVLLLEHHGAVTLGYDLKEAFYRMETLEMTAKMYRDSLIFRTAAKPDQHAASKAEPLFGNKQ